MSDGANKPVTVTMPEDWKQAAQRLAERRNLSLSELFRELVREQLPSRERSRLSTPAGRGRPKER